MNNFYVTLPSSVDSIYFNNKLSEYKTKLATNIHLEGNWEVGLSSISYTNSWFCIPDTELINFVYFDKKGKTFNKQAKLLKHNYVDIKFLLKQLNAGIKECENELKKKDASIQLPTYFYSEDFNTIYCELTIYKNFLVFPEMSDRLCNILGYNKSILDSKRNEIFRKYKEELKSNPTFIPTIENKDKILWAYQAYEMFGYYHTMFVHCDIISDSLYGEKQVPLLRFVEIPTNAKHGEQIVRDYTDIQYIPVRSKEFDTIQIKIKDELGNSIYFRHGRIIITLHFRKIQ